MARSFRIHKKDGTKVAEGESPLSITGVPPNTFVANGDYYAIAVENGYDSEPVNIPSFTTLPILATSVTLNKTTLTLDGGSSETLTATVLPANTTNKTVTWKSSNTAVATVSTSGVVSAVKGATTGTADITATTTNGKVATCTLTVNQYEVTVDGVAATAAYAPKDISQADYLALATKDADTLYRVQPTDSGSGRVHLLGSKIVDVTKKGDSILYVRNRLLNTSSKADNITTINTSVYIALYTLPNSTVNLIEPNQLGLDTTNITYTYYSNVEVVKTTANAQGNSSIIGFKSDKQTPSDGAGISSTLVSNGRTGAVGSLQPDTSYLQIRLHRLQDHAIGDIVGFSSQKFTNTSELDSTKQYTVAPEDILTVTGNSGGGSFG